MKIVTMPFDELSPLLDRGAQLLWPSELSFGSSLDKRVRVVHEGKVVGYVRDATARAAVTAHKMTLFGAAVAAKRRRRRY